MYSRVVVLLFAAGLLALAQDTTSSAGPPHKHVRIAGFAVSAGYSHGPAYYPGYYSPYYPGWGYDPFFLSPYMHPGFFYGYPYAPDRGAVKLTAVEKDADVYLDGAYAGQAGKLKTIWLEPGIYNLELRRASTATYQKRIYVLTGKTLKLDTSEVR